MSTWKLNDKLGGHTVAVISKGRGQYPWDVVVDLGDESFPMVLPATMLVEVPDPLPPQPPVGSFVFLDEPMMVLHRRDDHGIDWVNLANNNWFTWANICEMGTPVQLVPAPPVVELPWKNHGVEVQRTITDSGPGDHVFVSTKGASYGFAHLKPAVAREMAAALIAAADEAEGRTK